MEVDWQKAAAEFTWDGSLRDIYVQDVTISEWNKVLKMIRGLQPLPIYFIDKDVVAEIPEKIEAVFESHKNDIRPRLDFTIGKFLLQCHFFSGDEIEFSLDPRDMKNLDDLKELVSFMKALAELTQKSVMLTHESSTSLPIIEGSWDAGQISWVTKAWSAPEAQKTEMGFKVGDKADR